VYKLKDQALSTYISEKANRKWYIFFYISLFALTIGIVKLMFDYYYGIGTWGNNNTLKWAFTINHFVFFQGLIYSSLIISAIYFLINRRERNLINNIAESMAIIALICTLIYPILNYLRFLFVSLSLSYLHSNDLFSIFKNVSLYSVYFIVVLVIWYVSMIPSFAKIRDNQVSRFKQRFYNVLSIGWKSDSVKYLRWYKIVSIIIYLMVIAYFIYNLIGLNKLSDSINNIMISFFYSSFFLLILIICIYKIYDKNVSKTHIETASKITAIIGILVGIAFIVNVILTFLDMKGSEFQRFVYNTYHTKYWVNFGLIIFTVVLAQLLWFKVIANNLIITIIIALIIISLLWVNGLLVTISLLNRDYVPSSWSYFKFSISDLAYPIGLFGLFFTLFFLLIRFRTIIFLVLLSIFITLPFLFYVVKLFV